MTPDEIKLLHGLYETLTGNTVTLHSGMEHAWLEWAHHAGKDKFGRSELETVIRYLKANQKPKGLYSLNSMRFSRLIGNPENFEELLSLARLEAKKRARDWKAERPKILERINEKLSPATEAERRKLAAQLGEYRKKL